MLKANQCKFAIEVRVSFGIDICLILYRLWTNLGPILETKSLKLWSLGVSATNLAEICECQNQLDLVWKRDLSSKPKTLKTMDSAQALASTMAKVI